MIMWLTVQCFSVSDLDMAKQATGIEIAVVHRTLSDKKCQMSGTHVSKHDILFCTL